MVRFGALVLQVMPDDAVLEEIAPRSR